MHVLFLVMSTLIIDLGQACYEDPFIELSCQSPIDKTSSHTPTQKKKYKILQQSLLFITIILKCMKYLGLKSCLQCKLGIYWFKKRLKNSQCINSTLPVSVSLLMPPQKRFLGETINLMGNRKYESIHFCLTQKEQSQKRETEMLTLANWLVSTGCALEANSFP